MLGETISIRQLVENGVDDLNEPTYEELDIEVENVLVSPLSTADIESSIRPDGDEVKLKLRFPKSFKGDLRGCKACVRGTWYSVIGEPIPYLDTPTEWNMTVEVGVVHG